MNVVVLGSALFAAAAAAGSHTNEYCPPEPGLESLTVGVPLSGATARANINLFVAPGSCPASLVGFSFVAPTTATFRFLVMPYGDLDPALIVLDPVCSERCLNNGAAGELEQFSVELEAGQEIVLMVGGFERDSGTFVLAAAFDHTDDADDASNGNDVPGFARIQAGVQYHPDSSCEEPAESPVLTGESNAPFCVGDDPDDSGHAYFFVDGVVAEVYFDSYDCQGEGTLTVTWECGTCRDGIMALCNLAVPNDSGPVVWGVCSSCECEEGELVLAGLGGECLEVSSGENTFATGEVIDGVVFFRLFSNPDCEGEGEWDFGATTGVVCDQCYQQDDQFVVIECGADLSVPSAGSGSGESPSHGVIAGVVVAMVVLVAGVACCVWQNKTTRPLPPSKEPVAQANRATNCSAHTEMPRIYPQA